MFGKLFGKGRVAEESSPKEPTADMIRVHDEYGRELLLTRDQWRTNVLLGAIQSHWDDPEQLYITIVQALRDGFRADIVAAAQHLYQTDPNKERAATVWAIVLMEEGRLGEAQTVLHDFITQHGESGVILTNLAKVFSKRGEDAQAEATLWQALQLDPNQDNGMGWYGLIYKERGGDEAWLDAMRRVAALPGSWRAQLWLARNALQEKRPQAAMDMYRDTFARFSVPAPADFLMQMTGDMGNAGLLREAVALAEPAFVPETHGLNVGNNLIKAHLDLGEVEPARAILERLYAQKRPDWQTTLAFWDTEIAKVRVKGDVAQMPLAITMLTIEGPVWLMPDAPGAELFPVSADGMSIAFLGCSIDPDPAVTEIQRQIADTKGQISRCVPLFLAEQVRFRSGARPSTLVPYILEERSGGFVVNGGPWGDADAAEYSRKTSQYIVTTHLKPATGRWTILLRLVRTSDGVCLGERSASFPQARPQDGIPDLAEALMALLAEQVNLRQAPPPALYQAPADAYFPDYLLRLEQLLAVRCAGLEGHPPGTLNGEREILDGNIRLCLSFPHNVTVRLLLARTVAAMARIRPDILPEFAARLVALQANRKLAEPAQGVVQAILDAAMKAGVPN